MLMKIVTYVLVVLLVLGLIAAAAFYITSYKPMTEDFAKMKAGMPELEKARAEIKRIKDQEKKETAWLSPAVDALSSVLSDEIKAGKAEVLTSGNTVVVNIAENALYLPGSYTFAKESPGLRAKLATLLRKSELRGKDIYVGNTTDPVPAQGRGRKKTPAKDARTLAAERSAALVKDLEKNQVDPDFLIATAYSSTQPEIGFKIKTHKAVLIIENPLIAPPVATKQDIAPSTKASATAPAATSAQPKTIPIQQPAQPKTH